MCVYIYIYTHTTLTMHVPVQESCQQSDHDAACRRVPGPHVASKAVSSGMWLTAYYVFVMAGSACTCKLNASQMAATTSLNVGLGMCSELECLCMYVCRYAHASFEAQCFPNMLLKKRVTMHRA